MRRLAFRLAGVVLTIAALAACSGELYEAPDGVVDNSGPDGGPDPNATGPDVIHPPECGRSSAETATCTALESAFNVLDGPGLEPVEKSHIVREADGRWSLQVSFLARGSDITGVHPEFYFLNSDWVAEGEQTRTRRTYRRPGDGYPPVTAVLNMREEHRNDGSKGIDTHVDVVFRTVNPIPEAPCHTRVEIRLCTLLTNTLGGLTPSGKYLSDNDQIFRLADGRWRAVRTLVTDERSLAQTRRDVEEEFSFGDEWKPVGDQQERRLRYRLSKRGEVTLLAEVVLSEEEQDGRMVVVFDLALTTAEPLEDR